MRQKRLLKKVRKQYEYYFNETISPDTRDKITRIYLYGINKTFYKTEAVEAVRTWRSPGSKRLAAPFIEEMVEHEFLIKVPGEKGYKYRANLKVIPELVNNLFIVMPFLKDIFNKNITIGSEKTLTHFFTSEEGKQIINEKIASDTQLDLLSVLLETGMKEILGGNKPPKSLPSNPRKGKKRH